MTDEELAEIERLMVVERNSWPIDQLGDLIAEVKRLRWFEEHFNCNQYCDIELGCDAFCRFCEEFNEKHLPGCEYLAHTRQRHD